MPHSAPCTALGKPPKPPLPPSSSPSSDNPHVPPPTVLTPLTASSLSPYLASAASSSSSYGTTDPAANKKSTVPTVPLTPTSTNHPLRQQHVVAASTSFFALPYSLSSASLRSQLGLDAPPPGEIDWVSIAVVYWITLVSEASRGLMLPSTWPYFNSLGGSKTMLGVFVASFSMGRMATTIPLGYLSDNFSTSTVLTFASAIQVLGHFIYALAPSLPVLYASRIIVGFGSATMSVCRAHLTRAVPSSLRTHHFAYLSALQFIGFAVLPGFGGLLALLPELHPLPFLRFNGFTYPAYVLVICNLLCMMLIYSLYFDPPPSPPRRRPQASANGEIVDHGPDVFALVVCLLVNVAFRGVVAEFETVSTPFLMEQFGITYGGASFRISTIGFFGLFVYLGFKPIAKRFSDRGLVFFGLLVVVLGCLPLATPFLADNMSITVYVFCLGLTWSLAYPVGQTAILALFSKVLGGLPAGGFLGIFSASGSLARVFFAMLAGVMWSHFGKESVFAMILAYMSLAAVMVISSYRSLVPPDDVF